MEEEKNLDNTDEETDESNILSQLDEARQFADSIVNDGEDEQELPSNFTQNMDHKSLPSHPEPQETVYVKYRTEADVPQFQDKYFDSYKGAYGRHVALSNTYRNDNPRHLNSLDLQFLYDEMPTLRQNANQRRIRETAEFQMCRSNPEIGGFEAKIGSTLIKRESVDLKQAQTLNQGGGGRKRSGVLGFLRKKTT